MNEQTKLKIKWSLPPMEQCNVVQHRQTNKIHALLNGIIKQPKDQTTREATHSTRKNVPISEVNAYMYYYICTYGKLQWLHVVCLLLFFRRIVADHQQIFIKYLYKTQIYELFNRCLFLSDSSMIIISHSTANGIHKQGNIRRDLSFALILNWLTDEYFLGCCDSVKNSIQANFSTVLRSLLILTNDQSVNACRIYNQIENRLWISFSL